MKKATLATWITVLVISFFISALSLAGTIKPAGIKKSDKCRVCGMLVSVYPNWAAQVVFNDGTYAAFDGPKDMFKYCLNVGKFDRMRKQQDIAAVFVTEYYSTKIMDARSAFYVQGSDVEGPMGSELVPIDSQQKAATFLKDHKGKKILKYDEVRMEDLK